MQQSMGAIRASLADPALRVMFEARKRVFVDLLKWDVPVLEDAYQIDQFDTPSASYLVLTESDFGHRASARLLRSDGPHILKDLFPNLCAGPVPLHGNFREITRFCIEPTLPRGDRRKARNELVSALADHALANGIAGYTAVAPMPWFRQIADFGWQCHPLGPSEMIDGQELVALQIGIDRNTREDLERTDIYCGEAYRIANASMELAA